MNSKTKTLLTELEKTRETYWNITPEVGRFLNLLIKDRQYKNLLEIGTSNGYSGIWLAEAAQENGGHLYTIESHKKERFYLATDNFQKSGLSKNITQVLGHAPEAIPKTPRYFDFAFFDATKNEHLLYFEALEKRIKKGGVIITDNIDSHRQELTPYLDYVKSLKGWFSIEISLGTGLLLSYKN